jgi:CheY-like chemotaxis protein
MFTHNDARPMILVVEDVEETRDGIEKLLKADGYRVNTARNEAEAIDRARREHPGLILISLAGPEANIIATAQRIRQRSELTDAVPVVIFCSTSVAEGAEEDIGSNVHLARPDNFDQLRAFLQHLLPVFPIA